ncbi:hypothetical protein ZIOFF_011781 [Zingiber officinale]|uniref:VQ domain-containing protein n=1 Tax=Zingiber officinale TaxID=94328 RepID=A0A8J5HYS2_ZINOF|nr:hypothetical protein ZIOFF_011781 [Zingiber officinale]
MKAKTMKNRRGIKVVYISNPMRVTTSAASFRALVQQLTGPDSTVAADMANLSSSFVDDNSAVHDRLPPPLPESESQSVVGQPMLLSDQLWSGTAPKPAVEEETPWEVSYESLSSRRRCALAGSLCRSVAAARDSAGNTRANTTADPSSSLCPDSSGAIPVRCALAGSLCRSVAAARDSAGNTRANTAADPSSSLCPDSSGAIPVP